jgi:glutathione S-transferase
MAADLADRANWGPDHLPLNRFGEAQVLNDDGQIISNSNAIPVYVAKKYLRADWLPVESAAGAGVRRRLPVAAGKVAYGPCAAPLAAVFGHKLAGKAIARSRVLREVIDAELGDRTWIADPVTPTVADLSLYSYITRAPEGRIDIAPYIGVNARLRRVEALPGFLAFEKTPVGLKA